MKLLGVLLAASVSAGVDAEPWATGLGSSAAVTPVTRVVELLKGMSLRIEADHKEDEKMYETFVCWAKSIVGQKEKFNAIAQTRIDELTKYLEDLDAGRIDLTTERVDLEKDLKTVNEEIEVAKQLREKEAGDFDVASTEMQQAIDALTKAIDVLTRATSGHKEGVLLRIAGGLHESSGSRAREAAAISKAVQLSDRVLAKGDAVFLRRLLTGDVPVRANWKKLNQNATFKMNYKARSFKIQGTLAKLLETFEADLKDAQEKEQEAKEMYGKLMKSKEAEKAATEAAIRRMDKETQARTMSKGQATREKEALESQVSDDEGFIRETQKALADKKTEWKERQVIRAGELDAISKAIHILHNDGARDLFSKSYASQGYLLLQESAGKKMGLQARGAAEALHKAASRVHDSRLEDLAVVAEAGNFSEVIVAIDSMLQVLQTEETSDLAKKEDCEKDRADNTRDAIVMARAIDDLTDDINALRAKIDEMTQAKAEKQERVQEINKELKDMLDIRQAENKVFAQEQQDDQAAAALVQRSRDVLANFYSENNLMSLVQGGRTSRQPFKTKAGEAPPPPPKQWENPYGGQTDEMDGILAIMDMIHGDILYDAAKALKEEQAAVTLYTKQKMKLDGEAGRLNTAISDLNLNIGTSQGEVSSKTGVRQTSHQGWKGKMRTIAEAEPNCDFMAINFGVRSRNRKIEMDGLNKARAILSGGVFDGLPDPARELKPGDASAALVQARVHGKFLRATAA